MARPSSKVTKAVRLPSVLSSRLWVVFYICKQSFEKGTQLSCGADMERRAWFECYGFQPLGFQLNVMKSKII